MNPRRAPLVVLCTCLILTAAVGQERPIVVGSKNFTESYLLAEIMAQALEADGLTVERRFGFGGTKICYEALRVGEIDLYPEYTGTLTQVIFPDRAGDDPALAAALVDNGLRILSPLGFNNTYALAMNEQQAAELGIRRISDLAQHATLRAGFSHEFMNRPDGWPGLVQTYGLANSVKGIEHGLAYQAIASGNIELTDAYSTDGELTRYGLRILADDREFFPRYLAVPLAQATLDARAVLVLERLAGTLSDETMRRWNARIVVDGISIENVATEFLTTVDVKFSQVDRARANATTAVLSRLMRNLRRHLELTFGALLLACIVAISLAMAVHRSATGSRVVLYLAGLIQTIPSIALLALMIPLLGVGVVPALTALFLYSLLPILRNALTALTTVDPVYREVARAMGLTRRQQLRYVLMPLSAPHILAGIRTAAVISIGTATLAAFIGAGGLGEPIVTGLALNNTGLILQGAIPAAALAVVTELAFSLLERRLIPAHLRAA
jgi:osmoprotectant transport system permease protein